MKRLIGYRVERERDGEWRCTNEITTTKVATVEEARRIADEQAAGWMAAQPTIDVRVVAVHEGEEWR